MLTLFTTAKPFKGHTSIIQRNALTSWRFLHPEVEVILFGDDEGSEEICREFGFRYEPYVKRGEKGLKRIDFFFDRAQEVARHSILCYANCDIILRQDFVAALDRVQQGKRFLMIGRRWDTDVSGPLDFGRSDWAEEIGKRAQERNHQRSEDWIDYFAFSKGLFLHKIPPFVIGRVHWDNWLVWFAAKTGAAVVDASEVVVAVHQNHDYSYHPKGKDGVWGDAISVQNLQAAGGIGHLRSIADARYRLTPSGLRSNRWARLSASVRREGALRSSRVLAWCQTFAWHPFLNKTRSVRTALGLRRSK